MGTRKIGPAVAAGCTMVVKPAAQTPLSMYAPHSGFGREGGREGIEEYLETRYVGIRPP